MNRNGQERMNVGAQAETPRQAFRRGVVTMLPVLLGVIPVAVVTGVGGVSCGLDQAQAIWGSVLMYAAASQLVAYDILGKGGDYVLVFTAAVMINLRFLLYSAGMAPHLQKAGLWRQLFGSYLITDQAYALTMVEEQRQNGQPCTAFYFGTVILMWFVFQAASVAGVYLGASIPKEFALDFAVPLTFSALLAPLLDRAEFRVAAGVAAAVVILGNSWPNNLGFFAAALAGIAGGLIYRRITKGSVCCG